jgi:cobalt-zinc-cadmium efflux system outer membrane protein
LALIVLCGCATVKPDARFPAVQQLSRDRFGSRVIWDRGGPERVEVEATVDGLLSRPLSADDAVQIALLNNNALQATFEDLGVAQADFVKAGLVRNPNIAGFVRFPSAPPTFVNWNVGFDLFPLDAFLIPLRKRLTGAELDATVARVSHAVLGVAGQTRTAYYALWADEQILAAERSVADLAEIAADLAERQYAAGNIDDLRLASVRAARQQAALALVQAENAVLLSRERLRRAMGLTDSDKPWRIISEHPVTAAGDPRAEELVPLALERRLDLAAARREVERLEYALALTRKWWLSPVFVGAETERGPNQFVTGPHFRADIPLFDQKQAEVAREEALIRQARQRVADLEAQIRTEVRTAVDRVRTARRVARFYRDEVVPLRTQITAMTERRYEAMFLGVYELLSARSDEAAAAVAAARASQEFWTALSDLELAVSSRIPEPAPAAGAPASPERGAVPAPSPAPGMSPGGTKEPPSLTESPGSRPPADHPHGGEQ